MNESLSGSKQSEADSNNSKDNSKVKVTDFTTKKPGQNINTKKIEK